MSGYDGMCSAGNWAQLGKSAIAAAGEFELMFTNVRVHKIVRISKTN